MKRIIILASILAALASAQSRRQLDPTQVNDAPAVPAAAPSYSSGTLEGGAFDYVQGDLLYVTADYGTFSIFNIADKSIAPVLVGQLYCPTGAETNCGGVNLSYSEGLAVVGDTAYVAVIGNFGSSPSALAVVDLSNLKYPKVVNHLPGGVGTYLDMPECVAVHGTTLFVTGYNNVLADGQITAVDISTRRSPVIVGHFSNANMYYASVIAIQNETLYVTSRAGGQGGAGYVTALDVSTPSAMSLLWQFTTSTATLSYPTGIAVQGERIYVASSYTSSLLVIDASDSTNIHVVGSLVDTTHLSKISNVHLVWPLAYTTTYGPCLSGSQSYASVVNVLDPTTPVLATSVEAPNGSVCWDHLDIDGTHGYILDSSGYGGVYPIDYGGMVLPVANIGRLRVGSLDVVQDIRAGGNAAVAGGIAQSLFPAGGGSGAISFLKGASTSDLNPIPYSTWSDVPGATITLTGAGNWWLVGVAGIFATPADGNVQVRLNCAGTPIANPYIMQHLTGIGITSVYQTISNEWIYSGAASDVCKLQASKDANLGSSYTYHTDTTLVGIYLH